MKGHLKPLIDPKRVFNSCCCVVDVLRMTLGLMLQCTAVIQDWTHQPTCQIKLLQK